MKIASARIYEYASAHPNLVRVEEPVYAMNVIIYSAVSSTVPFLSRSISLYFQET